MTPLNINPDRYTKPTTDMQNQPHPFEAAVHKTAKLIGRPYMATYAMMKDWPLHKIERRYQEATNCNKELTTPEIRWWSLRKRDLEGN